jgi:hypothetical protein
LLERVETLFLLQLRLNASLKKFFQCIWARLLIKRVYTRPKNSKCV